MGLPVASSVTVGVSLGDRRRVIIEHVTPVVDCGRFPVRAVMGEDIPVEADVFADGHDLLACFLGFRHESEPAWQMVPMQPLGNDHWQGHFRAPRLGRYYYRVAAGIDAFATWREEARKRAACGQDLEAEVPVGVALLQEAARMAPGPIRPLLDDAARRLAAERDPAVISDAVGTYATQYASRAHWTYQDPALALQVERPLARAGAWYEFFPRSCGPTPPYLGSCHERLAYVADLGFDVIYLPPVHPIGTTHRKGPDNSLQAGPKDVGSPWAIGSAAGGHVALHPELGTWDDFRAFRAHAQSLGLEIALDIAFQCSPDHPFVQQHPEWFRHRPDGSIRYAENPPKKYQDIYPFDFESVDAAALWCGLRDIFLFWITQGVRIFRVDNPHTKSLVFWEWVLAEVKQRAPDAIFLAEAFTRPRIMERLAKAGFTQSYTYFTWRNSRSELTDYFTELAQPPLRHYFWPSLWPNTPDILPELLQHGGRPAFALRAVLAATLSPTYGIYGPAFELCVSEPLSPGSEEYRHSEKYQRVHWDIGASYSLAPLLKRLNRVRRELPVLLSQAPPVFHATDNDRLICYSKSDAQQQVLIIVNLDPEWPQSGWTDLRLDALGLAGGPFEVYDLLNDQRYLWNGGRNFVRLDPQSTPAHIFRIRPTASGRPPKDPA
ncbi:MAG TPA: alpha-1,4-glucan--maltose-1-phosphate maltosyltransferase [Acidiferrobacteraceae bacterium]|nr:alpha-1,4-glucan--maltose-1-phosphate maltosyltransferase [Acidiferrobacteraceae bacterium]